ncbi:V-type ATP synthase subunit F, partial [Staphylococcus aureus]|uniref:V-type ATP synthase subunit F n=1 Tax=Staphylococcus aureus TaxID=1280 RepID=UPI001E318BA6
MEYREKIAVVGDHDTIAGFALAGVNELVPVTRENCDEQFLKTVQRSEIGVIILQDDLANGFSHKTKKT